MGLLFHKYIYIISKLNHFSCKSIPLFIVLFPTDMWRTDFSILLFLLYSNICTLEDCCCILLLYNFLQTKQSQFFLSAFVIMIFRLFILFVSLLWISSGWATNLLKCGALNKYWLLQLEMLTTYFCLAFQLLLIKNRKEGKKLDVFLLLFIVFILFLRTNLMI